MTILEAISLLSKKYIVCTIYNYTWIIMFIFNITNVVLLYLGNIFTVIEILPEKKVV